MTKVGSYSFGIIVDRVFDTEEIVVKPVSPILRGIDLYGGNTILGDGSVIMILDPNGIAKAAGDTVTTEAPSSKKEEIVDSQRKVSLLVFKAGRGANKAVPLSLIARLEEIKIDDIEDAGDQKVVQYRGQLMPLVPFSRDMQLKTKGVQSVLVFSDHDRSMGLMVDSILDIVEEAINVQLQSDYEGLLGSAIIKDEAMDVIDVGYYINVSKNSWFAAKNKNAFGDGQQRPRVLLVDDSPFFRNMLMPMLNIAGYEVVAVNSADEAFVKCDAGEKFNIIISDIEMPGMNGFDFAQKVKSGSSPWKDIPIVALSSHASPQDMERGRQAGFNDYVAKFDRDGLMRSIIQTLGGKAA